MAEMTEEQLFYALAQRYGAEQAEAMIAQFKASQGAQPQTPPGLLGSATTPAGPQGGGTPSAFSYDRMDGNQFTDAATTPPTTIKATLPKKKKGS